uniref:glutamic acid-rich protein-like n=1 Tax=Epinephelus lanceolatus TaxID=310571 RepID=UPI001446E5C7|nr:glutamic acid-rich protein-like [Epinephelus lanceolatus]
MCKVQMLRALVKQRLTAAAEEIFGLFERTIAEYEEQLCRSKEENERQRKLLDAVYNPQLRLHRAEVQQQLLVVKEEVPPEQQEWSSSVEQEDPEPPHIKEEQEEPEVPADSDPDLQPDNEDKNGVSSEPDTDDSGDWDETREPQSDFNSPKSDELSVGDSRRRLCEKRFNCSDSRKRFGRKTHLQEHDNSHRRETVQLLRVWTEIHPQGASEDTYEDTHRRETI